MHLQLSQGGSVTKGQPCQTFYGDILCLVIWCRLNAGRPPVDRPKSLDTNPLPIGSQELTFLFKLLS